MISRKAILAGIFSAIVGIGMLAMPARAMAHDWDHDGGARHEHHDNGRHNGWSNHRGAERWNQGRAYASPLPAYRYGSNGYYAPYGSNYGYGNGYGNGYPANGEGMVSPRHPGLYWACDSQGHHCHWARRFGYGYGGNQYYGNNGNYGYSNGYYGNGGYGNGYYGNSTPLGGLGSLFGMQGNGGYPGNGGYNGGNYGNNGGYGSNAPLGGLGSLFGIR